VVETGQVFLGQQTQAHQNHIVATFTVTDNIDGSTVK